MEAPQKRHGTIMASEALSAIAVILHNSIRQYKPLHSKVMPLTGDPFAATHTGTVFAFRDKPRMTAARGIAVRSQEALWENEDRLTHWTPNPYRYGKRLPGGLVSGFSEDNLLALNTFMIDIDFPTRAARDKYAQNHDIWWDTIIDGDILATLIIKTDKGYQAFYVLDQAAYVRRNARGVLPVVNSAKMIAQNLKEALAKRLPQVDLGANDFGITRIPRNDNIVWFEPKLTHRFSDLQRWSIRYSRQKHASKGLSAHKLRVLEGGKQTDQAWFGELLRCTEIHATGQGGGVARHNVALTLALACYQSDMAQEDCDYLLDEWNTRLKDPQNPRDVANAVRDAYSGRYKAASPRYIKYISNNWFDGQLTVPPSMWYKFAKPRAERQSSHVVEWAEDVLAWVQAHAGAAGVQVTQRQLMAELEISLVSLQRVLAYLRAHNKLVVESKRGSLGYTVLQTTANIYKQKLQKMSNRKEKYNPCQIAEVFAPTQLPLEWPEIVRQIDQFFDQVDRQEPRRGAG